MIILCSAEEARQVVVVIGKTPESETRSSRPRRTATPPILPVSERCKTCHGAREVEANLTGEPGAFQYIPCPDCSSQSV